MGCKVYLLSPVAAISAACFFAFLLHYGALGSSAASAMDTPSFAPSSCLTPSCGAPAMWNATYCASLCLAGNATDHVAPLACFALAVSTGVAESTSEAFRTSYLTVLSLYSRVRMTIRQLPSFGLSTTIVAAPLPKTCRAATKQPPFASVQFSKKASAESGGKNLEDTATRHWFKCAGISRGTSTFGAAGFIAPAAPSPVKVRVADLR